MSDDTHALRMPGSLLPLGGTANLYSISIHEAGRK